VHLERTLTRTSIAIVCLSVVSLVAVIAATVLLLGRLRDVSATQADIRMQQARLAQELKAARSAQESQLGRLVQELQQQRAMLQQLQALHEDQLLTEQRLPPYGAVAAELFGKAEKVDCRAFAQPRSAVLLILGQSNAGNYGEERSSNRHGAAIANAFGPQCAVATEPLMGSDGDGGSPWVAVANDMVEGRIFDRVLLVPVTLGGTGMTRWRMGGDLYALAESTLRRLALAGIPPTHVLWVQGEAERHDGSRYRRNGGADYFDGLQELINLVRRYSQAKVFVSPTSSCQNEHLGPAPEIRWAQTEIVRENSAGVFSGPDLDALNRPEERTETCHLTEAGMKAYVSGWFAAIQAVEPAPH
jgi:Carbohydrate esterase, sialic acid-specific acetylesterase